MLFCCMGMLFLEDAKLYQKNNVNKHFETREAQRNNLKTIVLLSVSTVRKGLLKTKRNRHVALTL